MVAAAGRAPGVRSGSLRADQRRGGLVGRPSSAYPLADSSRSRSLGGPHGATHVEWGNDPVSGRFRALQISEEDVREKGRSRPSCRQEDRIQKGEEGTGEEDHVDKDTGEEVRGRPEACAKKSAAKKTVAKKAPAKKPAAKKSVAKKAPAKKPVAKKPAAKRTVAKKPAAKRTVAARRQEVRRQEVRGQEDGGQEGTGEETCYFAESDRQEDRHHADTFQEDGSQGRCEPGLGSRDEAGTPEARRPPQEGSSRPQAVGARSQAADPC